MADDLNFKHNVGQIPAGADVPRPVQRQDKIEQTNIPDWQGSLTKYGADTNWMSSLGSQVATTASTAIATELGGRAGKTPQGDIYPITNFDKNFVNSYQTQVHSTLGLQADKLITDSNLEVAKQPRITPELIASTNKQVMAGLQNIFKYAPGNLRPTLESQYGAQVINQNAHLTERMIGEQKEDQKDTLIAYNTKATQSAYELARSGNEKGSFALIESVRKNVESGIATNTISREAGQLAIETIQKSSDSGIYGAKADEARKNKTYEQFAKDISEKPPEGMTYDRWQHMLTSVSNENAQIHNMRLQSEQLALSDFKLYTLEHPNAPDIAAKLQDLKEQVGNDSFVKAQIGLLTQQRKENKALTGANNVANNWSSIDAHALAKPEDISRGFELLSTAMVTASNKKGTPMSREEAELHIASESPGPVKVYTDKLKLQLHSGDPNQMEPAGHAIEHLHAINKGNVIDTIDNKDMAMWQKYSTLKQIMPDKVEAAAEAKRSVYGKTAEEVDANQTAWDEFLRTRKGKGVTNTKFFMQQAGLSKDDFVRYGDAYGKQIEETYRTLFDHHNGDQALAQKQLKSIINQTYGYTDVNGIKNEFTLYPIPQTIGVPEEARGFILNDAADQIKQQFEYTNQKFKEGISDSHFEVIPRHQIATQEEKLPEGYSKNSLMAQGVRERNLAMLNNKEIVQRRNIFSQVSKHFHDNDSTVQVIQTYRNGMVKKYDVVLQASPFATKTLDPSQPIVGGYDVMLRNDEGTKNVALANPLTGPLSYHPNTKKIKQEYAAIYNYKDVPERK